jgi:CheY-like chemotaxis protein
MRKLSAMIVDDDVNIGRIYSKALMGIGLETEIVHDSQTAMARILATFPNLITLDVQMPRVSGLDILREIRATPALDSVKIMLVTANERAAVLEDIQDMADVILLKPVSLTQIRDFASRLLQAQ